MFSKPGGGTAASWDFQLLTTGLLRIRHAGTVILTSASTVTDNSWHHVVFVLNRSATSYVYVDGEEDATATADAYGLTNASQIVIGARFTATTYNSGLTGLMDEVAL